MTLDLSILSHFGKVAVQCDTEDKAMEFFKAMRSHYPSAMENWRHGNTRWSWYQKDTCYAPHVYDEINDGKMQFCSKSYWLEHGYKVIPIEYLEFGTDLGEFEVAGSVEIDLLGL